MSIGPIISMGIRIFGAWFLRRNDPDTIRFHDLRKAKHASRAQKHQLNQALRNNDIDSISRIINSL